MAPSSPLSFAARTVGESSDCPSDSEASVCGARKTASWLSLGHGRRKFRNFWVTEDDEPNFSGSRKTTSRISLGHGRRPAGFLWVTEDDQPGFLWGTEDGQPDFSGSRKTTSRISLGHGRRAAGFLWGAENEHAVGCGDARPSRKIHYDRASFFRC